MGSKIMKLYVLIFAIALSISACSSSRPKTDPNRHHVRYFYPTKMVAYKVSPPIGSWTYYEPKYEGTNLLFFQKNEGYPVFVDVSFGLSELLVKFNDTDAINANNIFFRTGKFSETSEKNTADTIKVGSQGVRCVKNGSGSQQHFGPSRDTKISGKWAGQGNTRFSYQIMCPFHMDGRHFWFVMDKAIVVADKATIDGHKVDVKAINDEIDRQFESVWENIVFSPALSQALLP